MRRLAALVVLLMAVLAAIGCGTAGPWPRSSGIPVRPLEHPTVAAAAATLTPGPETGYRFAVMGDQRALADGEWQRLMAAMADATGGDDRFLFVVDTGDIVDDGRHGDQFDMLRGILAPMSHRPYLPAVGNHELANNDPAARGNTAAFLSAVDPALFVHRFWYRKDVGPASFLFLDSNDFVYGADGGRVTAQLDWLSAQLAEKVAGTRIVVLHHPFVQSSAKHRDAALLIWDLTWRGRRLVDILLDGGVDLVLVGHTHTYERFRIARRADGRSLQLVNISGRPRSSFLWFGAGARRARDIRGQERAWLEKAGWNGLEAYEIVQEQAMTADEVNQFGLFTVEADGGLLQEMVWLDEDAESGYHTDPPIRLE
jgi:3',5'-cyclic AMP phosphodiesterase CpdA